MTVTLPIYMDNHATTRLDPRVLDAMFPYFTKNYGNAASRTHAFGWAAEAGVEKARAQVASIVGAHPREIVFTSGATESNNLAIKGTALALQDKGTHIVTDKIEHKAVLDSCRALEKQGFDVTYLDPPPNGVITVAQVADALRPDTVLVSVMLANNEVGTINEVGAIGALCRSRRVTFHTDAAQGLGKIPFNAQTALVDLASLSAHKVYGPKGIGALYVWSSMDFDLAPQMHGGGHEHGLRSGTLNVPAIVGFGAACEIAEREMPEETCTLTPLRDMLRETLCRRLPGCQVNGNLYKRLPGNLNVSFAGVDGESLIAALKDVALSSGSACTSTSVAPSYVLRALGLSDDQAQSSIRFGLGRFNTVDEVAYVADRVVEAVQKLRGLNPAWSG
jgi:cysteine desulfurase